MSTPAGYPIRGGEVGVTDLSVWYFKIKDGCSTMMVDNFLPFGKHRHFPQAGPNDRTRFEKPYIKELLAVWRSSIYLAKKCEKINLKYKSLVVGIH